MSGREPPRLADPDDWFADPSRPAPPSRRDTTAVEAPADGRDGADADWLDGEPAEAQHEGPIAGFTVKLRTLLAVAAIAVVLIVLAGLELGGVFSGSGKHPTTSPTTAPRSTLQTPTTTPTSPTRPTRHVLTAPATTLKPGDQGAQVKLLQRALAHLGYRAGAADGDYGPSTQSALTQFQKASGLAADGVLGTKTLQALKLALQRSG